MNTQPGLISVITPVHDCRQHLRACLDSLVGQSHRTIEILLVDDGSTDGSVDICDEYAGRDERIVVTRREHLGASAARNAGIEQARGEFLFFVDADDYLEPRALEILLESHRRSSADLTVGDFRKLTENSAPIASGHAAHFHASTLLLEADVLDYATLYAGTPYVYVLFVHCWGKLYLSRIVTENRLSFDPDLRNFEDVAFNFNYLNHVRRVFFVKEVIYNYRIHDHSQSFRIGDVNAFQQYRRAFDQVERFLRARGADASARVGHLYISCVIMMLLRTCAHGDILGKQQVDDLVSAAVNAPEVRKNLTFYRPSKKDSRIVPILMRLRLSRLIAVVCRYKYKKHQRSRLKAAQSTV